MASKSHARPSLPSQLIRAFGTELLNVVETDAALLRSWPNPEPVLKHGDLRSRPVEAGSRSSGGFSFVTFLENRKGLVFFAAELTKVDQACAWISGSG
ncbi:MAG: hypothetical protein JWM99_1053 [Verrucomicrobiales bacterium]|nr:hypothetical protein [Verrucomicrobiales bacterium]